VGPRGEIGGLIQVWGTYWTHLKVREQSQVKGGLRLLFKLVYYLPIKRIFSNYPN